MAIRHVLLVCVASVGLFSPPALAEFASFGELEIQVVDKDSGEPIAARMHLKDERGKVVRPPRVLFWHDHFVIDGSARLKLRPGRYTFELERGPEYRVRTGYWILEANAEDVKRVEMERFVDMKKEGWWSGDLHLHREPDQLEPLMRAEDLHVGPAITWWNEKNLWAEKPLPEKAVVTFETNRYYSLMAGEDERAGGALLYFGLSQPLPLAEAQREYPSPVEFLKLARKQPAVHVDIEKPFWWDMPVWVASGMTDSIGLCHNHLWRDGGLHNEAWGKPRDKVLFPGAHGNGRWTQTIYYHLLNCGLRIPPSAGSASGVLPNPVGYNRVYVYCGDELDYDEWWENLRAGKVVVTNGPLLRPRVNGELPGHVFRNDEGPVTLNVELNLSLRDPVDYLEVVKNGNVVHEVRLDEYAKQEGRLPPVTFEESGWLLVRAVTTHPHTYRFASTGPYYVEIAGQRRVSKESAQFFVDWVYERARQIQLEDAQQKESVLQYHRAARDFWQRLVESANAP